MGILDFFRNGETATGPVEESTMQAAQVSGKDVEIFKAYIPDFLYRPPFGMPRKVNTQQLKDLAANPYIFSVTKAISDEVADKGWEIKVKEEFQEEMDMSSGDEDTDIEEKAMMQDHSEKIKEITKFFKNPNGNEESLNHILRQLITDLCEVDSAAVVKVFSTSGEFKQMFSRDGSLFLKNPDIYGYMGNREDFVTPLPPSFSDVKMDFNAKEGSALQQQLMKQYSLLYKDDAAYFQYGWTAGSMPIPFGKREIAYMMQNPRADSIYGISPIQRLHHTILNLIYGIDFNLDFYTNNNMPEGAIELLGASNVQIKQFRENFEKKFKFKDVLGNLRKTFFKYPISSVPIKFTPFQLDPKQMDVIAQQQWFTKILWMCYGVNADEMGFTEDSNKATGGAQIKNAARKAAKPMMEVIKYHFDTQIIPEFFAKKGESPDFADVPLEFCFDEYDIEEDMKELSKFKMEMDMGIKTPMMIAKERGVNIEELEGELEKKKEEDMEMMEKENSFRNPMPIEEKPKPKVDTKSKKLLEIDKHIDTLGKGIVNELEKLQDDDLL